MWWDSPEPGGATARRSDVKDLSDPKGSRSNGGMPLVVTEGGTELAVALIPEETFDDLPPGGATGPEGRAARVSQR